MEEYFEVMVRNAPDEKPRSAGKCYFISQVRDRALGLIESEKQAGKSACYVDIMRHSHSPITGEDFVTKWDSFQFIKA